MKILPLIALLAYAAGPQIVSVAQDEKDPVRLAQAARDRYQRLAADHVSGRRPLAAGEREWLENYLLEQLKMMDGEENFPPDLRRFADEKAARLSYFCAPAYDHKHGEWYAMARSHCEQIKRKYGVDFRDPKAAEIANKNADALFRAYKKERRAGYLRVLKTLSGDSEEKK